jgi:hypothetical protein
MLKKAGLDLASALQSPVRGRELPASSPARIEIDELKVLSLDGDLIAPPEAAGLAEHLVGQYRAAPTTGDHLRIPPPKNLTGPQIRASLTRVLCSEARGAPTPEAAIAEAKMRRVLQALDIAHQMIQTNAQARM